MNIQKELERLTKNVYIPMVFYFPYDVLPYIPEALGGKLDEEGFFNSMAIIDGKGGIGTLSGSRESWDILSKSKILKTNLLQLMELKSQMKKETFAMVIKDYLDTVSSYDFIYTWMADNVARDIPEDNVNFGSLFTLQSNYIKEHLLQIQEKFIDSNQEKISQLNFDRIIESGKKFFQLLIHWIPHRNKTHHKKADGKRKRCCPHRKKWISGCWKQYSVLILQTKNRKTPHIGIF